VKCGRPAASPGQSRDHERHGPTGGACRPGATVPLRSQRYEAFLRRQSCARWLHIQLTAALRVPEATILPFPERFGATCRVREAWQNGGIRALAASHACVPSNLYRATHSVDKIVEPLCSRVFSAKFRAPKRPCGERRARAGTPVAVGENIQHGHAERSSKIDAHDERTWYPARRAARVADER
jgi:hypothetical protein